MTWDYAAEKKDHPCAICGADPSGVGMTLPLCHTHELEWIASEERTERATARQRFVDRRKRELEAKYLTSCCNAATSQRANGHDPRGFLLHCSRCGRPAPECKTKQS